MKDKFIQVRIFPNKHAEFKKSVEKRREAEGRVIGMSDVVMDAVDAHIKKWLNR